VSEREAIFVEAPPGYDDLWRARWSPFFLFAQYRHAVRVIRMPIASFHRLADAVGDPDNLTFIVNTARCGSTLLTQLFEASGRVVAISEPSALNIMSVCNVMAMNSLHTSKQVRYSMWCHEVYCAQLPYEIVSFRSLYSPFKRDTAYNPYGVGETSKQSVTAVEIADVNDPGVALSTRVGGK